MNNKKTGVIILLILLTLISLNSVYAFDLISTETSKDVCPSNTVLFTALVTGTGNFNVNYEGSATVFATVVPQGFTLNNGERIIYTYITPKFNTAQGSYNLNLLVTSGETKTITYNINVLNCNQVSITGDISKELCACNQETFTYNIINNGIYEESYELEVTGSGSSYVSLSETQFTLQPQESKQIIASYNAPCGTQGNYDFNLNVISLTSNSEASFNSQVLVNSCYDFNLISERTFVDMCEHTIQEVPITIENSAINENNFNLQVTGPAWANLDQNSLTLNANEKQDVKLILNPDYDVKGGFDVNIKAIGIDNKVTKTQVVKVNIRDCNEVIVDIEKAEDDVCNVVSEEYNVNIKNAGEFSNDFKLETNYPWASLDEQVITLAAGESKDVKLIVNPDSSLQGIFNLQVKATALDSSKLMNQDEIKLNLVNIDLCYTPLIQANDIELMPDTTATVEVQITNNGPQKALYTLGLSGSASSFVQLNPATIEVSPGDTEVIYLYVAPPFNTQLGNYNIVLSSRVQESDVLESKQVNIKVVESGGIGKPVVQETFWQKLLTWIKNLFAVPETEEVEEKEVEEILENITEEGILEEVIEEITEEVPVEEVIEEINESVEEIEEQIEEVVEEMPEEPVTEEVSEFPSEITSNLTFIFKDQEHSIKILEVTSKDVLIEITSSPQYIILEINETEKVDIDQDGTYDLELTLNEISDNVPRISTKAISEEVEEAGKAIGISSQAVLAFLLQYKFYIILGIIILIVLILIISYWKEIVDFFEEETEEDNKRKR